MWPSIRYVLLCGLRDRLFFGLALGILVASAIAATLGNTALVETQEMTLTLVAAVSRIILAVGLTVFVCFHIRSVFDSREMDVMLTRPISRARLVVAYWLGFAVVATLLVLPVLGALLVIKPLSWSGLCAWMGTLLAETWLVVAVALFCSLLLSSAVSSVMASLGFYVLSRMMAFFIMASHGAGAGEGVFAYAGYALTAISTLIPRLDLFAHTEWLVYGVNAPQEWQLPLIQVVIFIPLLLTAAIIDFRRREF